MATVVRKMQAVREPGCSHPVLAPAETPASDGADAFRRFLRGAWAPALCLVMLLAGVTVGAAGLSPVDEVAAAVQHHRAADPVEWMNGVHRRALAAVAGDVFIAASVVCLLLTFRMRHGRQEPDNRHNQIVLR